VIAADGRACADIEATKPPVLYDAVLEGRSVIGAVLGWRLNFIGEPTTTMFRKADLADHGPSIHKFAGKELEGVFDAGMWVHLLQKGNLIYLIEPLSDFRMHLQMQSNAAGMGQVFSNGWKQLRDDAARLGLFDTQAVQRLVVVEPLSELQISTRSL
jgi:hypothetical protein